MQQAEMADSIRSDPASAGKNDKVSGLTSRRGLIAGALGISAVALCSVPAVAEVRRQHDPIAASRRTDIAFWAAHRRWEQVSAEWNVAMEVATAEDEKAVTERFGDREHRAMDAMAKAPVTTLPALWAKMKAMEEHPHRRFCDGQFEGMEILLFNVERMAMREMVA